MKDEGKLASLNHPPPQPSPARGEGVLVSSPLAGEGKGGGSYSVSETMKIMIVVFSQVGWQILEHSRKLEQSLPN